MAWAIGAALLVGGIAGTPVLAGATATGTVITTASGPYGTMLVVGSGKYAGYTLYLITGDQPKKYSCTATIIKTLPGGPGSCTGPSNDQKAEWPAITTIGAPVAGAGVNAKLLGSVSRPGIGNQVTYAGYPLYLFDMGPGQVTGQGWDEPSLPPWHGVWWTVAPSGKPLAWPQTLTTTTIGKKTVLAALMFTGIGWKSFPVYSYSKDTPSTSACTGTCAVAWPPVISAGTPGLTSPLAATSVKTMMRADGTDQLTYHGKPLYLFAYEGIAPAGAGFAATGNGAGVKVAGGTFELVTP